MGKLNSLLLMTSTLVSACAGASSVSTPADCAQGAVCGSQQPLHIDAVDILLVVDDSASMLPEANALKAELPRLVNAIISGHDAVMTFPAASSVHVGVVTTDMGAGAGAPDDDRRAAPPCDRAAGDCSSVQRSPYCSVAGDDGVLVQPGAAGVTCLEADPGYIAYSAGQSEQVTASTLACVPVVLAEGAAHGCGFEQPLEAALKALTPAGVHDPRFFTGHGHGDRENAGFLRKDSLLVVVVISDEDDCSASDTNIFALSFEASEPYKREDLNLRCYYNPDKLYPVERYVGSLKALRAGNDNVVFAAIAGIPPALTAPELRASFDLDDQSQRDNYYDAILGAGAMQRQLDPDSLPGSGNGRMRPSCTMQRGDDMRSAEPPSRLVETARGFGEQGVLGSICSDDFGDTTGQLIRAIGAKLSVAAP
jgi:hypothetical protein